MFQELVKKLPTINFYVVDLIRLTGYGTLILVLLHFARKHLIRNIQRQKAKVRNVKREQARRHHY